VVYSGCCVALRVLDNLGCYFYSKIKSIPKPTLKTPVFKGLILNIWYYGWYFMNAELVLECTKPAIPNLFESPEQMLSCISDGTPVIYLNNHQENIKNFNEQSLSFLELVSKPKTVFLNHVAFLKATFINNKA